jgi:hypothetical protein
LPIPQIPPKAFHPFPLNQDHETHPFCIAILLTACCAFSQDTTKTYIINFRGNKTGLTKADKLILDSVARTLKAWPVNCNIISGNYGENEKRFMNGYKRIRMIVVYLIEKQGGDKNNISYSQNTIRNDDGFEILFSSLNTSTPQPHPNLRKKQNN